MPFLYGKMSARDIDLFNNRGRTQSAQGRRDQMIPLEDNTWVQKVPRTKHLSAYEPTTKAYIPSPRRLALESKLQEIVANDRSDFAKWLSFMMPNSKFYNDLRCHFHKDVYVFVELNDHGDERRYSNPYNGKDLAMAKYRRGKIFWAGFYKPQGK